MRTYKRLNNRGFTLIELMIVVAIVGVLAALAVYGVRKYLLNAKTAEARNSLGQMAKDASLAYERESMDPTVLKETKQSGVNNQLCLSAGAPVPDVGSVKGKKYQSGMADWNADKATIGKGFYCLKFSMTDPQYYSYNYTSATTSWDSIANGDLNGDGTTSEFKLSGAIENNTPHVAPNISESSAEE